jgi:hypothetical protein
MDRYWWERGWFDRWTAPLWGLAVLWVLVLLWIGYLAQKGGAF